MSISTSAIFACSDIESTDFRKMLHASLPSACARTAQRSSRRQNRVASDAPRAQGIHYK
jgi:hypothetical protein